MSWLSAFSSASKQAPPTAESPPAPQAPNEPGHSKPMPVGHTSVAHPHHHEGPTDLDLYRTFSPSEVGMWSHYATTGDSPGTKTSFWGKLFSTGSNK